MKYFLIFMISLFAPWISSADGITLVAAENFYGEVAKEIGGAYVSVTSILNNPSQDPHLFSVSPRVAKQIAEANIIVYNGLDYDPWMQQLLSDNTRRQATIITISHLLDSKTGDNPHLWYDPKTMPLYAKKLETIFKEHDSTHKDSYTKQFNIFMQDYQMILQQIQKMKNNYQGTNVFATEPIFNYMAEALGLKMQGEDFQLSIMNNIAPSPTQISNVENLLTSKKVRLFIFNNQVSNPVTKRLADLAFKNNIPVVGVSEIQPLHETYISWMMRQLSEIDKALKRNNYASH